MIDPYKKDAQIGLKKALGSLKKIEEMIENDAYCMDIAQQINASLGLLRNMNLKVFESHLHTCGSKQLTEKDEMKRTEFIHELVQTFDRTNRK